MKAIHWIVAAAALSFVQTTSASAGVNDPEVLIYRFPGVRDDGSFAGGIATVFVCTNFSGDTENVRFVTRNSIGTLRTNLTILILHLNTRNIATHANSPYLWDLTLDTGSLNSGTTAIAATSINIICTAAIVDGANPKPTGLALRGIRFNPVPGSQE